jgi:uncharacterized protein (UPF0303 family)
MDIASLEVEAARLLLRHFDEVDALRLGSLLVARAREHDLPIVIDIRTPDRTLFHAALPGSSALNDRWARRKSNAALHFHDASLLIGKRLAAKGESLAMHGLDEAEFAVHGGAVPIRVRGVGVVAAVTVSGLEQVADHKLAVSALEELL